MKAYPRILLSKLKEETPPQMRCHTRLSSSRVFIPNYSVEPITITK